MEGQLDPGVIGTERDVGAGVYVERGSIPGDDLTEGVSEGV